MIELSSIIGCICEGTAEEVIINKLLDAERLLFTRDQLLENDVTKIREARSFAQKYLNMEYDEKISIIRILDSRKENFKLPSIYIEKGIIKSINNIITAPEIEILIILEENQYEKYHKSSIKPSKFCKIDLGLPDVKSFDFNSTYWSDVNKIIDAIQKYKTLVWPKQNKNEKSLFDIMK